ncbi:TIR domain-containing protein [Xanthomonas campestris pv. raphani]|uniref:TIR domain-containing protein n=1 Tax=Xanthomonas campestris TaxID=339 RepID=UPI0013750556|nr:TIR domain-containing protein [Xanthomonas campestris]MEA9772614.1 TIR domain-containing protein [Xanthomonas campestris pv. raphani]MEA9800913.1 TIR domain-containing protein [Xanthomonas campestris pv. raphani]
MYNLLMVYDASAWDLPSTEFSRTRYLEYTEPGIAADHKNLTLDTVERIKSYPCLFMEEQFRGGAKIGYIRNIRERANALLIEYEFDEQIGDIDAQQLVDHVADLDINVRNGEQYRTHWALKDVNLFETLNHFGIIGAGYVNPGGQDGRLEEIRFKVAFSFPGELRGFVRTVADRVKDGLGGDGVFYDDDFVAQLARPNLDNLLQAVYLKNSDLLVVFLSADYERKMWCGVEWRAIRAVINNKADESVMLVRADDAAIPGIFPQDGYIDINRFTPEQVAGFVLQRVRLQPGRRI